MVHEYALDSSDECLFVVKLDNPRSSVPVRSSSDLLRWLGQNLPSKVHVEAVRRKPEADEDYWAENPRFLARCNSCLLAIEMEHRDYNGDIVELLHAQLREHEYPSCHLEIKPDHRGPFDPNEFAKHRLKPKGHEARCLEGLSKRKAKIVSRGQRPVSVGLSVLLERVRSTLKAGMLPVGLSSRPCEWGPLFGWIRDFATQLNEVRETSSEASTSVGRCSYQGVTPKPCRTDPTLDGVIVVSRSSPIKMEAVLWPKCALQQSSPWLMIQEEEEEGEDDDEDEEDDDDDDDEEDDAEGHEDAEEDLEAESKTVDEEQEIVKVHAKVVAKRSSSSAAPAASSSSSSSSAAVAPPSADVEAKARSAPRQKRK